MALKIITKKRFENSLQKVSKYLNDGWGKREAEVFVSMVIDKLNLLSENPNIGVSTAIKNTKSTLAGKGFQNKIYYRVEKGKLIVIDMKDTRTNPKTNPFNKTK